MKLLYCPECAAPLKPQSKTDYICQNGHPYWNNPRATATVIIMDDNKLLVAKRAKEPHKGKLDTPGGFVEYGETPQQAAKRETLEETGLVIDDLQLLDSFAHEYDQNVSTCEFVFLANKWQGNIKPMDDVEELSWQPLNIMDGPDFAWSYPGLVDKIRLVL